MMPLINFGWFVKDFIRDGFYSVLLLIDSVLYLILNMVYEIFLAVARIDIFGGSKAGLTLYNDFTHRIYMIISVIMVFIFAYQMILVVINPDGEGAKNTGNMVKRIIISVIFVALFPTIFRWMSLFQNHILTDHTIPAIVLGIKPSKDDGSPGKNIGIMIFTTFFHPWGTNYSTFVDSKGNMIDQTTAVNDCKDESKSVHSSEKVCNKYYEELEKWINSKGYIQQFTISLSSTLKNKIGDADEHGVQYLMIISAGACALAIYFFLSYSIDIGVRAVKLGVLQLIAPIPMMMYSFPQAKKTFDSWKNELIKTYVELFVRLGVIFFSIHIIQLLPKILVAVFKSSSTGNPLLTAIAMILLIFGILKFAKDAPELFKTIFASAGNWFAGLNFKPGVQSRIEGNEYGMKAIGLGAGLAGGVRGWFSQRYGRARQQGDSRGVSALKSAVGLPRGIISGAIQGIKQAPQKLDKDSLRDTYYGSADVVKRGEVKFHEGIDADFRKAKDAADDYYEHKPHGTGKLGAVKTFINTANESRKARRTEWANDKEAYTNAEKARKAEYWNNAPSIVDKDAQNHLEILNSINKGRESNESRLESIEKAIKEMEKKAIEGLYEQKQVMVNGRLVDARERIAQEQILKDKKKIQDTYKSLLHQEKARALNKPDEKPGYQNGLKQELQNFNRSIGGLGKDLSKKVMDGISDALKDTGYTSYDDFIKNITKENHVFTEKDISTIEKINKVTKKEEKELNIQQLFNAQISSNSKPGNSNSSSGDKK